MSSGKLWESFTNGFTLVMLPSPPWTFSVLG